jgi:crotonobetainyl-CoA:carnitine CoA-transferase CaiB-like acyl-CoA transferase
MEPILKGVRVLGLEQQVAGPTCTMMLADQGAQVIKIERPGGGDTAREMAPLLKNDKGEIQSGYFARFNRGKKSVTLDMQKPEGMEVLWDLIKNVDIVVDNLKPGLMEKLGFTWDKVKEVNPALVYVAISGFGRMKKYEGPYSKRLAYDIIAQAMAGLMHTCGNDPDGPPTWLGFALGDSGTGVYAAYAAMLGYVNRLKTGKGEYMDVSMYDCMIALAERSHHIYNFSGKVVNRGPDTLIAPWGPFPCKDGYVAIIVPTEAMWKKFLTAIGRLDLLDNPDLQSGPGRGANMRIIRPIMNEWMKDKTKLEVCDLLMAQGLPCGPVQTSEEVAKCPHIAQRDLRVTVPDPIIGELTLIGSPIKMEEHEPSYTPLPGLGADTDEVLASIGYDAARISALRETKAI